MKQYINNKNLILCCIALMLFAASCRQPVVPTEEDLAGYGWVLYEEGKYEEAREWFFDAVYKDAFYADGFNGLGWCFGKLRQADSARAYFTDAQSKSYDPYDTPNLKLDLFAGLVFSYSGMNLDSNVIMNADSLFFYTDNPDVGSWYFSHDNKINHLDIRLERALALFNLGLSNNPDNPHENFQKCRDELQNIYNDQYFKDSGNAGADLDGDVRLVSFRMDLANRMEQLQQILKNI